jgi:hypothetical protein
MPEPTLYERLGGAFAIAAVVDHFSDAIVRNPIVGQPSIGVLNLGGDPATHLIRTGRQWVSNGSSMGELF